jgi:hypothetical protein
VFDDGGIDVPTGGEVLLVIHKMVLEL